MEAGDFFPDLAVQVGILDEALDGVLFCYIMLTFRIYLRIFSVAVFPLCLYC
jgi:hypothetical protein